MSAGRALWSAAGFALGLGLLAAAVSSPLQPNGSTAAASRVSGAFGVLSKFVAKVVDPSQPAIGQRSATPTQGAPTAPSPANPNPSNPITAPPKGSTAPVGDTPFGGGTPVYTV